MEGHKESAVCFMLITDLQLPLHAHAIKVLVQQPHDDV